MGFSRLSFTSQPLAYHPRLTNLSREDRDLTYSSSFVPTELHSKNYVVDKRNKDELDKLPADTVELTAVDQVEFDEAYKARFLSKYGMVELAHMSTSSLLKSEKLPQDARLKMKSDYEELTQYAQKVFFEKDCRVSQSYEVKEDAQVMLLWNLDVKYTKLANGSRGVIKGYFPTAGYKYLIDKEIESREDDKKPDDKGAAEKDKNIKVKDGSKVKDEPNVKDEPSSKKTSPDDTKDYDFSGVNSDIVDKVKGFLRNSSGFFLAIEKDDMELILRKSKIKLLPFVQFTDVGGKSAVIERFRVIRPQPFTKVFRKVGVATRWQVPLVLAWAISIHKSQGLTIERLLVDLVDCFAVGQAYVACSRGKSIKQMTLKNFKVREVKTSEKVKKFYRGEVVSSWKDSIVEFDRLAKEEMKKQKEMNTSHKSTPCGNCGRICVVRQIQTNRNNNKGKWFLACPYAAKQDGHTWEFVNTMPLLANNPDGPDAAGGGGGTVLEMFVPGQKGTIVDALLGKKFCLTGVFPELGGGSGLKLGKDKMKELIENFGGVVTTSVSGRTDYVITGIEPGAKRLEDAASKGVTALDSAALRNILMGGDFPATKGSAEKKTNALTKFFKSSNENDDDAYEV
jgi:ATP-dependent DNA helicase PIF1